LKKFLFYVRRSVIVRRKNVRKEEKCVDENSSSATVVATWNLCAQTITDRVTRDEEFFKEKSLQQFLGEWRKIPFGETFMVEYTGFSLKRHPLSLQFILRINSLIR